MGVGRITRGAVATVVLATIVAASPATAGARPASASIGSGASVSAATPCARGAKACPIRIVFRPGRYTGQARSSLTSQGQERWFVVRAQAGQTMVVVVNGKGATGGTVYFPGGGQDGGPGGRVFDGTLPTSGDYRIRVTESLMAEPWSGWVDVVVLVY
jgi:hypothetical protein